MSFLFRMSCSVDITDIYLRAFSVYMGVESGARNDSDLFIPPQPHTCRSLPVNWGTWRRGLVGEGSTYDLADATGNQRISYRRNLYVTFHQPELGWRRNAPWGRDGGSYTIWPHDGDCMHCTRSEMNQRVGKPASLNHFWPQSVQG